nr:DoxX family protein [Novosphingobium flavum]
MLAAIFGFVGWNKAFAPLAELARHGAWTVHLPAALGRAVGWSELVCALALLGAVLPAGLCWCRSAALVLIANQLIAAAVHTVRGETAALPQNGVLIALLLLVAALAHGILQREREI